MTLLEELPYDPDVWADPATRAAPSRRQSQRATMLTGDLRAGSGGATAISRPLAQTRFSTYMSQNNTERKRPPSISAKIPGCMEVLDSGRCSGQGGEGIEEVE